MTMLRVGCVVFLGLIASVVAAGPQGKVVRIERPRANTAAAPIVCEIKESLKGICLGGEPRQGDLVTVVNDQNVVAEVRILTAKLPNQTCDNVWNVSVELVRGDISQRTRSTLGIIDGTVDARIAKTVPEKDVRMGNLDPDTHPLIGVDRDGNGDADVVITYTKCPNGAGATFECFEIWARRDKAMTRTWAANIKNCM